VDYLNKAREIFKDCGAEGWMEKIDKSVTDVS